MEPFPENQLCESCSKINILLYFQRAIHSRVDQLGYVGPTRDALKLGTVDTLHKRRSQCSFCRLVIQAVCNLRIDSTLSPERLVAISQKTLAPIECWLYSYCFADSNPGDIRSPKAFRIRIATQMKGEGPCTREEQAGDIQLLATDAKKADLSELFHGRSVSMKVDIELCRSWVDYCERGHGELCEEPNAETGSTTAKTPQDLILIDVNRMCLCYAEHPVRYVALSYCWPKSQVFRLTQSILSEMLGADSIKRRMVELPLRIQDAIHITMDLGETYLWVDAVCIIQDVEESKKFQILQMDRIYGAAFLTIVLATSVRAVDDIETYDSFYRYRENPEGRKQIVETVQNVRLAVPFDTVSLATRTSRWDTRAWTYQEALLSKRKLYFTECQVYFQCCCSVFCEDTIGEGCSPSSYVFVGTNLYNLGGPYNSTARANFGTDHLRKTPYLNPDRAVFDYKNHVYMYTSRRMSDPSDCLHAFYGIQNVLEYTMGTEFLHGLPRKYLDMALLWTLVDQQKRREVSSFSDRNFNSLTIPSWTWAGWDSGADLISYYYVTGLRSEVSWFLVGQNHVTPLEIEAFPEGGQEFPQHGNQIVRAEGRSTDHLQSIIIPRAGSRFETPTRERLQYLVCWTATTFFKLAHDEVPLYDHGWLWRYGVHLAIHDEKSRWAGSIMMDRRWIVENCSDNRIFEFMLLSRSEAYIKFRGRQRQPAFFDKRYFDDRPWCLLNVMMIQRKEGCAERIAVGFIHEDAWVAANPKSELIALI